jgi:hypothetical protein
MKFKIGDTVRYYEYNTEVVLRSWVNEVAYGANSKFLGYRLNYHDYGFYPEGYLIRCKSLLIEKDWR